VTVGTIAFAVLLTIFFIWRRRRANQSGKSMNMSDASIASWKQYLKGQGVMLCGFLILGGAVGWVSVHFGSVPGRNTNSGKLIEYRKLDLSQHEIYEEMDVEHYAAVTVMATVTQPSNGAAVVRIYGDSATGGKSEINHLDSVSGSWSRWEQTNYSTHLSLIVAGSAQPGSPPATEADVLVYLTPR
jgi:heme A synthase